MRSKGATAADEGRKGERERDTGLMELKNPKKWNLFVCLGTRQVTTEVERKKKKKKKKKRKIKRRAAAEAQFKTK